MTGSSSCVLLSLSTSISEVNAQPFLEPERTRTMKKVGAYVDALLR